MVTDALLPPVVRWLERSRAGRAALRRWRRLRGGRHAHMPRVLCVGYVKTGTSSFGAAMRRLGFSHYGYDVDLEACRERGDLSRCLEWAAHFDSLDDLPWLSPDFIAAYRERFPGSYYVVLVRDEQDWLRSYLGFYGRVCPPEEAIRRYRDHCDRVLEILASEPHVLRLDVCAGEGYERLCPFLGMPVPDEPFPWVKPRK
jgi:hypothetical protein